MSLPKKGHSVPRLDLDKNALYLRNAYTLAHLANAAYSDTPQDHASFQETEFDDADTFGDDNTFGFVTSNEEHVVLAFRGTDNLRDWITNLTIAVVSGPEWQGRVHKGFADALDFIWVSMRALLKKRWVNGQTFWITGHSLGGALATLATKRLPAGWKPFATHTFGQPRVGEQKFAGNYGFKHHRFVNNDDIVPTLPPRLIPIAFPPGFYTHVGSFEFFNHKGKLAGKTDDELGIFPSLVETLSPIRNREAKAQAMILDGIKDHKMSNYITRLEINLP